MLMSITRRVPRWFVALSVLAGFACATTSFGTDNLYPALSERKVSPGNTEYYVNAANGNDTNSGKKPLEAWRTFKNVNGVKFSPGDVIHIEPGEYHSTLAPYAEGTEKNPVRIVFAKGRYDFFTDKQTSRKYHISNNDDKPDQPKNIAIMLEKCANISLSSEDALLMMRGKSIMVVVDHSDNVVFEGLRLDYKRPTMSEVYIEDVADTYADIKVNQDSTYAIDDKGHLSFVGEGWRYEHYGFGQIYDPKEDIVVRTPFPLEKATRFEQLPEKNMIRAYFPESKKGDFKKGMVYQTRNTMRKYMGVFQNRSKNIVWKNFALHYTHGMGVVSQFCENISCIDGFLSPRHATGRTIASWADFLHFSSCRGKIIAKNLFFNGANDDAINIHGIHLRIMKTPAENQLLVRFMHRQTYGLEVYQPGDTIDFIHIDTMTPYASRKVVAAKTLNPKEILVTVDEALPDGVKLGSDAIENATWTPEAYISGCTIINLPTRGFLLTTRKKVVVENNLFYHLPMPAILVESDAKGWYESGFVRDMTIKNNTFLFCLATNIQFSPGVKKKAPTHQNIRILNNNFYLSKQLSLVGGRNVGHMLVDGNKICLPERFLKNLKASDLVNLDNGVDIKVENNKILPLDSVEGKISELKAYIEKLKKKF